MSIVHIIILGCYCYADSDDLFAVNSEVLPVADKWKSIGLALRLKPFVLNKIERDYSYVQDRLQSVLTEWLNKAYNTARFGEPSWQLLVAAVAHPAGGNNPTLAQDIARKYNGECVMLHALTNGETSSPPPPSPQCNHDDSYFIICIYHWNFLSTKLLANCV